MLGLKIKADTKTKIIQQQNVILIN